MSPKTARPPRREPATRPPANSSRPLPPSSETSNGSPTKLTDSPETSPTSASPGHWRPQPDDMMVPEDQAPHFMIETARLFQLCLNRELEELSLIVKEIQGDAPVPKPVPPDLMTMWAMLTLAHSVAQQLQEKHARNLAMTSTRLWTPANGAMNPWGSNGL